MLVSREDVCVSCVSSVDVCVCAFVFVFCRVCVACRSIKGSASEAVTFTTLCTPPDTPPPPRILLRTKSSVGLQWKV